MEVIWTPYGPPAAAALDAAVARAQGADPLATVHVATPNRYAALAARRALAARPTGLANVRCEPLARVAGLLSTPELIAAGRRPLGSARWYQAVRAVLPGETVTPATVAAYARAFEDLRRVADSDGPTIAAADPHAARTVARFHEARALVRDTFDDEDALVAAAAAVRARPEARAALGTVVLWLPTDASPAELAFLDALRDGEQLVVVFGSTGEPATDAPVVAIADALGVSVPPAIDAAGSIPPNVTLRRAPDPEEEVRAALRTVLEHAERGVPLSEHAILMRNLEPYGRIVHEQAAAAGIAIAGPDTRRLVDTMLGRFLTDLLALDPATMHRDEYVAWLASAPILDPGTGERVRALRWDTITRVAGLVVGADTFVPGLDAWLAQRTRDLDDSDATDPDDGRRRAIERDLADGRALRAFTEHVVALLSDPEPRSWSEWAAWCTHQLRAFLGSDARRRDWPEAELTAALRVESALDALGSLEGSAVERHVFAAALALELDAPCNAIGRFGTGVFVGRVDDAIGTTFRHVTILGVNDGAFPGSHRDDPLLPDRARLVAGLPVRRDRRLRDRLAFLGAIAAGTETICSFSTSDPRRQRGALASRWIVQWASAWAGTLVGAEDLRVHAPTPWLETVTSFAAGLQTEPALHAPDATVRALAAGTKAADTTQLARTLAAARSRRAHALSPFQGDVGPDPRMLTRPTLSPTSLETWAKCPRAFFFAKVLDLADVQRPEALDAIRPDERGTLVHRVLERFINEARPRSAPNDAWDAADRELLNTIFDAECAERVADGRTGRPVRWLVEQRRLRRQLLAFLDQDNALRAARSMVPDATEMAFGIDNAPEPAVELAGLPGLHGIADRVDKSPDGTAATVYDYKTGSAAAYRNIKPENPTASGTRLQLPVYALAAQRATGASNVRAAYWFLSDRTHAELKSIDLTPDVLEAFGASVATIANGIHAGLFPAVPGARTLGGFEHCRFCEFDRICPSDRDRTWEHIQTDPKLAPLHALTPPGDDA